MKIVKMVGIVGIVEKALALGKFLLILSLIMAFFLCALCLWPLMRIAPYETRKILMAQIRLFSQIGLSIMGVEVAAVQEAGRPGPKDGENYFIVANHLSYLDILIIFSFTPACFVTSQEIRQSPLLGQLATLAGCLFVERRSRERLPQEIESITKALFHKLNVVVFPEATSTNGREVLRFRNPLFQAAINADRSILPLCLNYESIDGQKVSVANRDLVFWYGDMTFFSHLWNLMKCKSIKVRIDVFPPIERPKDYEKEILAAKAHFKIKERFCPVG